MHPQKLKEELYDILTLADFMLAKAPTKIKTMINMTREEEIQLKRRVDEVTVNDLP